MLLLWGAVALGAGPVEVEGERVKLDAKEFGTKAPVEVVYRLYTATRGPDKVLVCVGYVTSNLPHEWFKITVAVKAYHGFKDATNPRGTIADTAGSATVELAKLKPGYRTRFVAYFKNEKGHLSPAMVEYSVASVDFERLPFEEKGK